MFVQNYVKANIPSFILSCLLHVTLSNHGVAEWFEFMLFTGDVLGSKSGQGGVRKRI